MNIEKYLTTPYNITLLDETVSTNDDLKKISDSAKEFTVIASRSQTGGRGRKNRFFFSPKNCGFYFSIFLKPKCTPDKAVFITTAAAVAVCDAIKDICNTEASVKWVNDVFIDGRKVCGILTEASCNPKEHKLDYAVVGIGINLYRPKGNYPDEIKDIAGAVCEKISSEERDRLVGVFLRELLSFYKAMPEITFYDAYKERLLYLGEEITVREKESFYEATVIGVDERLRLKVKLQDGKEKLLYTEEITIRKKEG